jgi:hypothetical protein
MSLPSPQRSRAAYDSAYVVCDPLPVHNSTPQFFILLNRWCSTGIASGLNIFSNADDIYTRSSFKLHRAHQTVNVPYIHFGPSRLGEIKTR